MPGDCGGGVVPFLATLLSGFWLFIVPVLCVLSLLSLALLSFWPVIVVALPFLLGSVAIASVVCVVAVATLSLFPTLRVMALRYFGSRAFFLLPFHAVFIAAAVSLYSLFWSIAIGACLFVQGEVLWGRNSTCSGGSRHKRWDACVQLLERWSWPVFHYFPMEVRLDRAKQADVITGSNHDAAYDLNIKMTGGRKRVQEEEEAAATLQLDGTRPKLFCYHPHGVYAIGLFSLVFGNASGFAKLSSSPRASPSMLVGVASALLHVPVLGKLCSWFGFVPASRDSLDAACCTASDLAIVPGGIAEMTLPQTPGVERLYLRKRRGFVRLALAHGREIVPVYCFGETRVFKQYNCFQRTRQWLSRTFRVSIVFFRGRNCTLIPRQVPLHIVVGRPLRVPHVPNPEPELVESVHLEYMNRLRSLFDRHKVLHPEYKDSVLEIH